MALAVLKTHVQAITEAATAPIQTVAFVTIKISSKAPKIYCKKFSF
jgi:hypothetical protein